MPDDVVAEAKEDGINSSPDSKMVTPQSLVTEDHVRATLSADKGEDAYLTTWKVVDFTKKGDNYACVVSSVEVKYVLDDKSLDVIYIVKLNPCRNFESRRELSRVHFEKEAKFYLDIIPQMNSIMSSIGIKMLNFPKCIYVSLEENREIIFLEDLRSQGFKMSDRRRGLDEAHVTLMLRELARFHAASILLQAQTPDKDISVRYPLLQKGWNYFLRKEISLLTVFETQMKHSKELLAKVGGYERAIKWIDSILPSITDILEEQVTSGRVKLACHGDCWSNNSLFRYSEDGHPIDVMLLDLQLVNYSSPATDLNYLLYSSTTGEVRQPNLETLLFTYYSTFSSVLEAGDLEVPFTQAQLLQEFREKNTYGAIFAMVLLPLFIIEPEDAMDLSTGTDDDLQDILDDVKAKSMALMDNNIFMRPRFLSMFDDMMEAGVIP